MGLVAVPGPSLWTYQAQLHLPLFNCFQLVQLGYCVVFLVCGLSGCSEFPRRTQCHCIQGYSSTSDGYWFDRDPQCLVSWPESPCTLGSSDSENPGCGNLLILVPVPPGGATDSRYTCIISCSIHRAMLESRGDSDQRPLSISPGMEVNFSTRPSDQLYNIDKDVLGRNMSFIFLI